MKIERIECNNFLGLHHFAADLTTPVLLVSGPNGSGKSSLLEAVRFALLGDSPRVALKKDFPGLLTDGAKEGDVWVTVDGLRVGRAVRTAALASGGFAGADALPFVLGAQRFADLPAVERRRFLFALTGVLVSPDGVAAELLQRGHGPALVERVKPLLLSGFDAAAKEAGRLASEARGAWRGATGEAYGTKKAEGWEAPMPPLPADVPDVRAAQDAHDAAVRASGAVLERRAARERAKGSAGRLRALAATAGACRAEVGKLEAAAGVKRGTQVGPCPKCGAELAVAGKALVTAAECAGGEGAAPHAVEAARARLAEAERAAAALPEVEALAAGDDGADAGELAELDRSRVALEAMQATARAYDAAVAARAFAGTRTAQAAGHHKEAVAWAALEADLSPDGLPAAMLARALGPLNERLVASHTATGWPLVQLQADMAIRVNGRAYGLLSESERWRADAVLAEAVAHAAGLRLLVLDRFDVLDLPGRSQFVRWLAALAGEYDTILAAGTLKAAPASLPAGVAAVWMGPVEAAA
jgi:hypothetical protein